MDDLLLVAGLRRRQFADSARYWLRVLGYEPGSRTRTDRAYGVYLTVLSAGWAVAMALIALQGAAALGQALPVPLPAMAGAALPWAVLAGQVLTAAGALRSSPLKLTYPDMTYLVGSPVSRGALAVMAWALATVRALLPALPVVALAAVALAQGLAPGAPERSAAAALALALPVIALTIGLAWCLGLARAALPAAAARRPLWLVPFVLLPLAACRPGLVWPGRALALAVSGQAQAGWATALWPALLPLAGLVAWLGGRVRMAEVTRESETHARIQALGMGVWLAPDVVRSIRRRAALAARPPFLRLPGASGAWALVARSGLALARDPASLLSLVTWGGLIAGAASWLVAANAYPPQWAAWLALAMFAPPAALAETLRADAGEPFLRQLLLQVALRQQLALPFCGLTLAALGLWLATAPAPGAALTG
ncbi:MAG TPA: hypothetical protein PLB78_11490, partial [Anaerolineae bacterium]|nr:hypothetical protein [Anaerolineae bacterium]